MSFKMALKRLLKLVAKLFMLVAHVEEERAHYGYFKYRINPWLANEHRNIKNYSPGVECENVCPFH